MSQQFKTLECRVCSAAGFPGEKICFVDQLKTDTGKAIPQNLDRSKHQHKKQQGTDSTQKKVSEILADQVDNRQEYWRQRDLKFEKIREQDMNHMEIVEKSFKELIARQKETNDLLQKLLAAQAETSINSMDFQEQQANLDNEAFGDQQ